MGGRRGLETFELGPAAVAVGVRGCAGSGYCMRRVREDVCLRGINQSYFQVQDGGGIKVVLYCGCMLSSPIGCSLVVDMGWSAWHKRDPCYL